MSPQNQLQPKRRCYPPALSRRSWLTTDGVGRYCLLAYTWATWSCARLWNRSELWSHRNSPTSSVTPKSGTTATCPGEDHAPFNVDKYVQVRHLNVLMEKHISCFREEWQWLQALSSLEESVEMGHKVQSPPHHLLQNLRTAIKDLMAHINVPNNQVRVNLKHFFQGFIS